MLHVCMHIGCGMQKHAYTHTLSKDTNCFAETTTGDPSPVAAAPILFSVISSRLAASVQAAVSTRSP